MPGIFENFTEGIFDYAMSAYSDLGIWMYPLIFLGIIGFLYTFTQSITVAIIGIIITFAIYGTTTIFIDVPDMTLFLYIVSLVGLSMLFLSIFLKMKGE